MNSNCSQRQSEKHQTRKTKKDVKSEEDRHVLHGCLFSLKKSSVLLLTVWEYTHYSTFFFFAQIAFRHFGGEIFRKTAHTDRRLKLLSQPIPANFLTACFHNVFLRRCPTGASHHGKLCVAM